MAVPRSSFYFAKKVKETKRSYNDNELSKTIVKEFVASKRTYGKRRIQACLQRTGQNISLERIARLMKQAGLIAANKAHLKRLPVVPKAENEASDDLVQRNFNPTKTNEVWVTDISYISTTQGWLYLAVVMDLYSRRVIGWKAYDHQRSELVIDALKSARARRPAAKGVKVHSDQGSQYRSKKYGEYVLSLGFKQSMGAARTCYDNAPCESFFGSYKNESLHRRAKASLDETRYEIFNYIEGFYNKKRLHSKLGYLSPMEYEKKNRVAV